MTTTNDLIAALQPIISRVRTDVTAIKVHDGGSRWVHEPLTHARLVKHIEGGLPRGCCPIKAGESVTRLAVLDLDSHKGAVTWAGMADAARRVTDACAMEGVILIPFRSSGGKGLHLFALWDAPQDAYSVRQFFVGMLAAAGFSSGTKGVQANEIEVFPKQNSVPATGFGNQFILPLAGASVPLDHNMQPMAREDICAIEWPISDPVPLVEKPQAPVFTGALTADFAQLQRHLAAIPNTGDKELDYDQWRNVIFAIHHETGGSPDGLALAHEFSSRASKYDPDLLDNRIWPYITSDRDSAITGKTIGFMAREHGYVEDVTDDFDVVDEPASTEIPAKDSGWSLPGAIGADEWGTARSTPTCVVDKMLFADVATLVAPGGMGKTTLILFKAVHLAIGRPLFGLPVHTPGPVLILTSEDSRELLVARLRHICQELFLTDDELALVRERVRISDLSGRSFKLTEVVKDVVRTTKVVEAIAEAASVLAPVWLVIDPAVSFGVGESRVNDAEQGLIEAARYLRNHLPGCCVEYVHHTGKTNGRDKTIDQYSGRGGSAFADGSRMVMVLQSLDAKEWLKEVGEILEPGCSGLVLARAKLSYCPPQPPIYLRRRGYLFEVVVANSGPVADERQEQADKLWAFLADELACGRRYNTTEVKTAYKDLPGRASHSALMFLEADGRLEERERPKNDRSGRSKTYLHPVEGALSTEGALADFE